MNISTITVTLLNNDSFNTHMRSVSFILSCTGLIFNLLLIIIFLLIGRRKCATYFLLQLMTICDFLYCTVYFSIMVTLDQYLNLINHQILCPLSFFLTPFTFTGSTLLLLVCLLHFITNFVRKYDTVLGQISGRLSVVFVLAFIIIRSVLSSTSIELIRPDPDAPHILLCTIDMNTPTIVATVQKFNHIFSEVTDILVYIGWIIIIIIYIIKLIRSKKSSLYDQTEGTLMVKPHSFSSFLSVNNINNHGQINISSIIKESSDTLNLTNENVITNKQKHKDVSLVILSISFISIIFYLPIMISKYTTLYVAYRQKLLFTEEQSSFLQILQHTTHLFCLSIRFLPYFIFDKRIHLFLNQMIGMKCMKIERNKYVLHGKRYKLKDKYNWRCHCYRRQKILEFNNTNENEYKSTRL